MLSQLISPENLKVLAAVCGVIGSLILAYRVTGILSALSKVAALQEINNAQRLSNRGDIVQFKNTTALVDAAQRKPLLYTGFGFFIISAILQLATLYI
jgi:hypothetical protein